MRTRIVIIVFCTLIILSILGCQKNHITNLSDSGFWKTFDFESTDLNFFTNGRTIQNQFYATNTTGTVNFLDYTNYQVTDFDNLAVGYDYKPIISEDFAVFLLSNTNN